MEGGTRLGIRVARGLYGRWRLLAPGERQRLAELAQSVKDRALNLRGAGDPGAAENELFSANEELAEAMVDSARTDPHVDDAELRRLREDLARELERLASGEVQARRVGGRADPPAASPKPAAD